MDSRDRDHGPLTSSPGSLLPPEMNAWKVGGGALYLKSCGFNECRRGSHVNADHLHVYAKFSLYALAELHVLIIVTVKADK